MWILIRSDNESKTIGEGYISDSQWVPERKGKRLTLKSGERYWLFLYCKANELDVVWTPGNQEGVLVHKTSLPEPMVDPKSPPKYVQLMKIRFQVINDGVLPHVIRWRFAADAQGGQAQFWHLPLHVSVSRKKINLTAISLGMAPFIGLLYEMIIAKCSGQKGLPDFSTWLVRAVGMAAFSILFIGVLLQIFYSLWERASED